MSKSAFYLRPHGNFLLCRFQKVCYYLRVETWELSLWAAKIAVVRLILGVNKSINLVNFDWWDILGVWKFDHPACVSDPRSRLHL